MKNVDTKKNFAKRITVLTILLIALSISNAWGVSVAYDFSVAANNPGDAQNWFSDDIGAYASWSATKGGSNNPKYYNTGSGLRIYNGGKFTITSDINMSSITLTFSGTGYTFSTSNTNATQTVSPNAKTYEWSVSRTCRLQKVEITYASGGCDAIDVTGGSAITLPAGSTTYNTSDWLRAGAAFAYPTSATTYSIGDDAYCVSLKDVADFKDATGIRFKNGSVLTISNIVSNYGIDVEIVASGTNNFTVSLSGAASNVTGNNTTLSISTTSTTATLTISKSTSNQGNITYIKITPKVAACSADPTIGDPTIPTSFTLTSLTGAVSVNGSVSPGSNCTWEDMGLVWGASANPTTSNNKKVIGGSGSTISSFANNVQPSGSTTPTAWVVGATYYVRIYGKNGADGAGYHYSTNDASFTLRSITYNSNGGSDVATQYVNSGGSYSAPTAPTKTGYTFGGWYTDNGTFANAMDWSSAITTNKELYAKWTVSTYTINLDGNGATTAGTASVTATYNSATLSSSITNPEKTDYIFSGWYSGSGGTGSLVIDASGVLQENVAGYTGAGGVWTKTAGTTLYAKWTEHTYTNYRTVCCPTVVVLGTNSPSNGTVTFSPAGPSIATCDDDQTVTMTIAPALGYQLTAWSVTGTATPSSSTPAVVTNNNSSATQVITLTFAEDSEGTYTANATFTVMQDNFYDYMHDNATQTKEGNYGTAPNLSSVAKGDGCSGEHYKFIGWIPEGDMNMETGVPTTTANMVAGGATGKYATNTNYYAIWAEEE